MPAPKPTASLPLWPTAGVPPLRHGVVKRKPEDFRVTELPLVEPAGEGEHLWLRVRKRGCNTTAVAAMLARAAGVPVRDVSYAGLKDRQAVTEQWFSIHLPGRVVDIPEALDDGVEVLTQRRHDRKLRRGALRGNRFRIVVRDCEGERNAADAMLSRLATEGFPNYFGEQRFGRDGGNIVKARQMLRGKRRVRDRAQRSLLISAARSLVFNDLLARRVEQGSWHRPIAGDLMLLGESNSLFAVETVDEALLQRAGQGEIHPSGPLPGSPAKLAPTAEAAELENAVLEEHATLIKGLAKQRVTAARRALRVVPAELSHHWLDDSTLELTFSLPSGAYATSLLRELIQ